MSWQRVATVLILVSGALGAIALHQADLAWVLAGAAAGFAQADNADRRRPLPPQLTDEKKP